MRCGSTAAILSAIVAVTAALPLPLPQRRATAAEELSFLPGSLLVVVAVSSDSPLCFTHPPRAARTGGRGGRGQRPAPSSPGAPRSPLAGGASLRPSQPRRGGSGGAEARRRRRRRREVRAAPSRRGRGGGREGRPPVGSPWVCGGRRFSRVCCDRTGGNGYRLKEGGRS